MRESSRPLLTLLTRLMALGLGVFGQHVDAAKAPVSAAEVSSAIERFVLAQTPGPGTVSLNIGQLPATALLDKCYRIEPSLNPGARALGRANISLHCTEGASWKTQVPVYIRITVDFVVPARSIGAGQAIAPEDISVQSGDLAELPAGALTDPTQVIGQMARTTLLAGRPLRADQLRAPFVVRSGQVVTVMSGGDGFSVSNEGTALNAAAIGEVVRVRMGNGQVVSGKASREGKVSVGP